MTIKVTVQPTAKKDPVKFPCIRRIRNPEVQTPYGPLIVFFLNDKDGIPLSGIVDARKANIESWHSASDEFYWEPCSVMITTD